MQNEIAIEDALNYILAGKCLVVFANKTKGTSFRYKVSQDSIKPEQYWIRTRLGKEDILIGLILENRNLRMLTVIHPLEWKVFETMWQRIVKKKWENKDQGNYAVLHEGRCGRCGRELKDFHSIRLGIGPECAKSLGIK